MPVSAWQEAQLAFAGAWRFARADRGALGCFDRSRDGFWRSFRAAVVAYPFYLMLVGMHAAPGEWALSGTVRIVTVETIGYVISWVGFPLLMLPVTRALGREPRFFDFMVPYNWCQVPLSAAFALAALPVASGLPGPAGQVLEFVVAYGGLVYEWYIARVALDTSGLGAALVVLVDLVLALVVGNAATSLH
jgi:hypothetical protein